MYDLLTDRLLPDDPEDTYVNERRPGCDSCGTGRPPRRSITTLGPTLTCGVCGASEVL